MVKLPIVVIGAVTLVAVAAYGAVRSRKQRPSGNRKNPFPIGSDSNVQIDNALLNELSQVERRFVSFLVAERMSEDNIPFAKRDAFWRDYPHVWSNPVIDLDQIAKASNMDYAAMTTQLTRWLMSKGVAQHPSVSTMLENYFMEKARIDAEKVYARYTTNA